MQKKLKKIGLIASFIAVFTCVLYGAYSETIDGGGEEANILDHNNSVSYLYDATGSDAESEDSSSGSSSSQGTISGDATGDGDDVADFALKFLGNPYVWGGESLTEGCDCSGFTLAIFKHFNAAQLPHDADLQRNYGVSVDPKDLAPGDLIFYGDGVEAEHVSIYVGNNTVCHASNHVDGIKTSSPYNYRTVIECRRIVKAGTKTHVNSDGTTASSTNAIRKKVKTNENDTIKWSPANAAYFNYYTDVSRNKSTWQVYNSTASDAVSKEELLNATDTDAILDEATGDILIRSDSKYAVTDYFKNDEKYFINPYLLYSMNYHLWGKDYVYPESFLKPVAHDKDYKLLDIEKDGDIQLESPVLDDEGKDTGKKSTDISDYGIASILKYSEKTFTEEYKGTYEKEDYFDKTTGEIKQKSINESYCISSRTEKRMVLVWAQTFAGSIEYKYIPSTVLNKKVEDGESDNEKDNTRKVLYKTEKVNTYIIVPKSSANTASAVKTCYDLDTARKYCEQHPAYTIYGATYDKSGKIMKATPVEKSIKLYKYRSDSSGLYTNFIEQASSNTKDIGNKYLRDYLTYFSAYKPSTIDRDPEVFRSFSSSATSYSSDQSSAGGKSGSSGGSGNDFASFYATATGEKIINKIWDTAVSNNYSEEQAAAILGNLWQESRYNITVTNEIGAYGLCQWLNSRRTQIDAYAAYCNSTIADEDVQIRFMFMELDRNNTYTHASCQWLPGGSWYAKSYAGWLTDKDTDSLTKDMCVAWERPGITDSEYEAGVYGDSNMPVRQAFARDALNKLKGRKPSAQIALEKPTSTNGTTNTKPKETSKDSRLTDEEQAIYDEFYYEGDSLNVYDGNNTLNYYSHRLTQEEQQDTLLLASALIRGISTDKARLDMGQELWEDNYISNLVDINGLSSLASTLDSVDLSGVSEFLDFNFLWPFTKEASSNGGGLWVDSDKFSSRFGPRVSPTAGASSNHKGLDIALASDSELVACSAGTVDFVGWQDASNPSAGGGYYVSINHGTDANGRTIRTMYFHMKGDSAVVNVGDTVKKGQKIGLSDNSGASTGPHLHLGITVNGVYYNPLAFYDMKKVPMLDKVGGSVSDVDFTTIGSLPSDFDSSYRQYLYFDNDYTEWK